MVVSTVVVFFPLLLYFLTVSYIHAECGLFYCSFGYFLVGRLGLGISRVGPVLVSRRDSGTGSLQKSRAPPQPPSLQWNGVVAQGVSQNG